jgi:putative phosphoesterase
VRIGLVSDVHCNAQGLEAALAQLGTLDLLLCAGDIVLQYRFSDDVISLLRAHDAVAIQGNHDKILLSPHGDAVRRSGQGERAHWDWLAALPMQRRLDVDGWRLLLAHGAPWDEPSSLHCEYVYPTDAARLPRIARHDAEIVVLGHTHFPMLQRQGGTLVVNPGSCGEARNRDLLSCGLIDTARRSVTLYHLEEGCRGQVLEEAALPERWADEALSAAG